MKIQSTNNFGNGISIHQILFRQLLPCCICMHKHKSILNFITYMLVVLVGYLAMPIRCDREMSRGPFVLKRFTTLHITASGNYEYSSCYIM